MRSDEEWEALLGEEQRARWAAEQDCQHYRERALEAEAGVVVMRQALEEAREAIYMSKRADPARDHMMNAALATDAGRAHLERGAEREALGRKLAALTREVRSACKGDLEDCLTCFHMHRCRRADAALTEARAAGWLQEEKGL